MALIPSAVAVLGAAHTLLTSRLWLPTLTQLRHGGGSNRPNLQRPLPMHYKRKRMLAVCLPKYPEQPKICLKYNEDKEAKRGAAGSLEGKPYHQFLVRELRKDVEAHLMIAVMHTNSFRQSEFIKIRIMLFDLGLQMRIQHSINTLLAIHALRSTRFEPMLKLMSNHTALGFCTNTDLAKLLRALKKMPQFILLGLVIENRLLHRDDVEKLARLDVGLLRSQLCGTLERVGRGLLSSLEANQMSLTSSLASHSEEMRKPPN